jgi:hypothetical protein
MNVSCATSQGSKRRKMRHTPPISTQVNSTACQHSLSKRRDPRGWLSHPVETIGRAHGPPRRCRIHNRCRGAPPPHHRRRAVARDVAVVGQWPRVDSVPPLVVPLGSVCCGWGLVAGTKPCGFWRGGSDRCPRTGRRGSGEETNGAAVRVVDYKCLVLASCAGAFGSHRRILHAATAADVAPAAAAAVRGGGGRRGGGTTRCNPH